MVTNCFTRLLVTLLLALRPVAALRPPAPNESDAQWHPAAQESVRLGRPQNNVFASSRPRPSPKPASVLLSAPSGKNQAPPHEMLAQPYIQPSRHQKEREELISFAFASTSSSLLPVATSGHRQEEKQTP
eukprot:TRINITY_DN29973_c0_g1_i1.p1 TRINITY_DN29973_c0_g1~~TRINITY_DN29973_c0_g1_i1.p1  ORF type:complete len:146 (+),score=12.25 TRINITY_DN29973_c0_g1_i1:50-439(+)